ncbi:MAG: S26 family signal peptidase, partial [Polyangiaceae bacterium]
PSDDPLLTASIAPTLEPGDLVVLARHGAPSNAYLVRCADPQVPGRFVVGRAIAKGGQTVGFDSEVVAVDGHCTPSGHNCDPAQWIVHDPTSDSDIQLECEVEEYGEADFEVLRSAIDPAASTQEKVEPGRWFLVSDDRHVHLDSRDYGGLAPGTCQHITFRLAKAGSISLALLW